MLQPSRSHDDATEQLTEAARYFDYRVASNPLGDGGVPPVPGVRFPATLHEQGPTRVVPLDTSLALGCGGPATTPSLSANFVHACAGDAVATDANATSQLFFAMRGAGTTRVENASGTRTTTSRGSPPTSCRSRTPACTPICER